MQNLYIGDCINYTMYSDAGRPKHKQQHVQANSSVTFVTKKSGNFHFWMATAPGTNMLSTIFWLIIVHPVRVKTYRSLKIKFFVKVKNEADFFPEINKSFTFPGIGLHRFYVFYLNS